jgi:hypothetical protein
MRLLAAKGMAGFINGKSLRKSSHGPGKAFAAAFTAATLFVPTSEFLTATDVLEDSAVPFICAVFNIPIYSLGYQSMLSPAQMIHSILSLPKVDGSLSDIFTSIAPMVPAENTALPEISDVAWQMLRPGHPDSVAGQLRQSLLIGFVLALAIKGLADPDCLVLPAPEAPGVQVRSSSPATPARLSARVESIESQLALLVAAVASAEVASAARIEAMEARLLAARHAVPNAQHPSRFPSQPGPVMPPAAGTSCSVHPPVVFSSGSDDSFSDEDFSEHAESLATIDPQSYVPVSPPPGSPSYAALVFRIHQEYGAEVAVPATISHIAFALATEGVLLATIVGGIYSVSFRFTSKTNQSKSRSLILTELFRGPGSPTDCSATMMSALRDCWPSSFAQFPAMEAEQARLLDARWSETITWNKTVLWQYV